MNNVAEAAPPRNGTVLDNSLRRRMEVSAAFKVLLKVSAVDAFVLCFEAEEPRNLVFREERVFLMKVEEKGAYISLLSSAKLRKAVDIN